MLKNIFQDGKLFYFKTTLIEAYFLIKIPKTLAWHLCGKYLDTDSVHTHNAWVSKTVATRPITTYFFFVTHNFPFIF